ncbi:glycosyltransferase family 9 protein [Yeosuana aromativorans]|nr:glycosyltransferase family 9 protein [Yeosuana aromativorans]
MPKQPKHIVAIRLSAMGDVAMTVPVIRALVNQHPQLKITVLTRELYKPFFRHIPNVSVFPAHVKEEHKGVLGLKKLAKQLKAQNIDVIADLHNVLRTNILKFFLSGYPFIQINKGREEKKALTTGKVFKPLKTTHQRYADVFEQLGFPIDLTNPTFPEKVKLSSKIQSSIQGDNPKMKTIGIAPFAAHTGKMYPLDLMEQVIEMLSKDYKILLFGGGKQESKILEGIESSYQNVKNIAGKSSLDEQMDIVSNLDLMLSMDSANAHIAAMLGIKVITIWGVTHPFAGFAPFNQPSDYALTADRNRFPKIPTSVYGNSYPETYKDAAGTISPETIISKIKSVI